MAAHGASGVSRVRAQAGRSGDGEVLGTNALPRASLKTDHYETMAGRYAGVGAGELHLNILHITGGALSAEYHRSIGNNAMSRAANEFRYEKLTWPEINDAIEMRKVCVVPCGAVEQHGAHLPLDVTSSARAGLLTEPAA